MPRLKFIQPLSEVAQQELQKTYQNDPVFKLRQPAHTILINNQHYTLNQLPIIFQINRDNITWILDKKAASLKFEKIEAL